MIGLTIIIPQNFPKFNRIHHLSYIYSANENIGKKDTNHYRKHGDGSVVLSNS